jgi:hypothetical protein
MKLFNIILFSLLSLACRCQSTDIDGTIELLRLQVDALEETIIELSDSLETNNSTIIDLSNQNAGLLTVVDSLTLTIEGQEAENTSSSFIRELDTAYVYISDSLGNMVEIRKYGSQINTMAVKGNQRISSYWTDTRRTYFTNDTITASSMIEDSVGYKIYFVKDEIEITKRK